MSATKEEKLGMFLQRNTTIILGILVSGGCCALLSKVLIQMITGEMLSNTWWFVLLAVWTVISGFFMVPPLFFRIGRMFMEKGRDERYAQFRNECDIVLSIKALGSLYAGIAALTSHPYPSQFYLQHKLWNKVFAHRLLKELDIDVFRQAIGSVARPELLPIVWKALIKRLIKEKGISCFRDHYERLYRAVSESSHTGVSLEICHRALHALSTFPETLQECLDMDLQNPDFSEFFDMEEFVPLMRAKILEHFTPEYPTLSRKDKALYENAFSQLEREFQIDIIARYQDVLLSPRVQEVLNEELSPLDLVAIQLTAMSMFQTQMRQNKNSQK